MAAERDEDCKVRLQRFLKYLTLSEFRTLAKFFFIRILQNQNLSKHYL
jgi:hypothetical protein